MTMTLTPYTRELTGFTPGILTNADPMFHPISCPYASFVYDSSTELTITAGGAVRRVELCGIPAYWRDDVHYPNNVLGVEWEQNRDDGDGGFAFENAAQGGFGTHGKKYSLMMGRGAGAAAYLYYGDEVGGFTQVATKALASGGRVKFKASLTHTGTANRITAQYWNGLAWVDLFDAPYYDLADGTASDMGDHFSLVLRTDSSHALNVRNVKPHGLIADVVFDFTGQSELNGRAATGQRNTNANLVCVRRNRSMVTLDDGADPLTSGGWGGSGGAASGSYWQNGNEANGAGWVVNFVKWYSAQYGKDNIICNAMGVLGSQCIAALLGPASLDDRYDTSTAYATGGLGACRDKLTAMLAGDGQNGCPIIHIVHQGTSDVNAATSQAAYEASFNALLARWAALQPTSTVRLVTIGDRVWNSSSPSEAENQAIRDAHLSILTGDTLPLGDEGWITGEIGSNVGWRDYPPGDSIHPGHETNAMLSLHAQYGYTGFNPDDVMYETEEIPIVAGGDDGHEKNGAWGATGVGIYSGYRAGGDIFLGGYRFQAVDVPADAIVYDAKLVGYAVSLSGTADLNIYGVDEDDAAAFSSIRKPSALTKTDAVTNQIVNHGYDQEWYVTDQFKEIQAREGYATGQAMSFVVMNNGTVGNVVQVAAFENVSHSPVELIVRYTMPTSEMRNRASGSNRRLAMIGRRI